MTVRESWEETSFQVFTDEDGVLRSGYYPTGAGLVDGNVAVDFVWGNIPMQPDDDRADDGYINVPQVEDAYWTQARFITSEPLDPNLNSHVIATEGYCNFPAFIPNYSGDGDTGLETVVPNVIGKSKTEAQSILAAAFLDWSYTTVAPVISAAATTTTSVTFTVDDTYNLRKGDTVWFDSVEVGSTPYGVGSVVLTGVTPTTVTIANVAEWSFDDDATGEIWGISNSAVRIIDQDSTPGSVVNRDSVVPLLALYID